MVKNDVHLFILDCFLFVKIVFAFYFVSFSYVFEGLIDFYDLAINTTNNNNKMSKKLDSVRRSLFQEFDDSVNDDSFEKMGNSSHQKSSSKRSTSIKMNSTAIAVVVILTVVIAAFSKFHQFPSNFRRVYICVCDFDLFAF